MVVKPFSGDKKIVKNISTEPKTIVLKVNPLR
jgi:hypothetical protein